jgi:hypothetical protein
VSEFFGQFSSVDYAGLFGVIGTIVGIALERREERAERKARDKHSRERAMP